jgi:osmotically-inducible protein OsmY
MTTHNALLTIAFCSAIVTGYGQTGTKADNTKVNKGDQNPGAVTADQQKMNAADQDLTKRIRQSIMADKSLSTYAHNVKIITQGGMVTLKGPVKSDAEQKNIFDKAVAVTGSPDKVSNQITVKQ